MSDFIVLATAEDVAEAAAAEIAEALRGGARSLVLAAFISLGLAAPAVESLTDRRRGSNGPIPDAPSAHRPETRADDAGEVRTEARPRTEDRACPNPSFSSKGSPSASAP